MKRFGMNIILVGLIVCFFSSNGLAGDKIIKMSTTTSTEASGLLDVLLPELERDTGFQVKVIAKGTGAAIRDGMDGNVDVIFVHARAREEKFVKEGYGTRRYAVMHNDFVILGPEKDPAGIQSAKTATQALTKIANAKSPFISRGDDSGTHTKEQALWKATGLSLEKKTSTIVKKGKKREVTFIHPAGLEPGLEGLWTPVLNFRIGTSGCQHNCIACGHVCPTAAIRPIDLDERTGQGRFASAGPIRIGTAFIDRGRCLPWSGQGPCIVCEEHCPTSPKAIYLVPQEIVVDKDKKQNLMVPQVNLSRCVGCGVCVYKCPVKGEPAVYVTSVGETRSHTNRILLPEKPKAERTGS